MASAPVRFQGCGRGVFGLKSWEPLRKPGAPNSSQAGGEQRQNVTNGSRSQSSQEGAAPGQKQRMVAKYSFKANQDSPLGNELTVKQGEKLFFLSELDSNSLWWLAQNDQGDTGYVPANHMMILKDTQPGLPWLQNQLEEEEVTPTANNAFGAPPKGTYKPYKSSYDHDKEGSPKQYYCEICEKQLNGPKPYNAHMASKAHREMEEYLKT